VRGPPALASSVSITRSSAMPEPFRSAARGSTLVPARGRVYGRPVRGSVRVLLLVAALGVALVVLWPSDDEQELRFLAPAGPGTAVDAGPDGPSPGDTTVLAGELLDADGEPAGRFDGVCTLTSVPEDDAERRQRCAVTLTVGTEDGEDELQLAAVGRLQADDVRYSVVGGSGPYADASGEATFEFTGSRARITVRLED
jgi:hypothetical protein